MSVCLARLTPAFDAPAAGRVHSVFERTANLMLRTPSGPRLLTLTTRPCDVLPDSALVPPDWLDGLEPGMPAALSAERLTAGGRGATLARDATWDGRVPSYTGEPTRDEFLALARAVPNGFGLLPERLRLRAESALLGPDAARYLGLGGGLTPAYDDACVGVMALCRAAGREPPFRLRGLDDTTDVSARYLTLAREGYFGGPVLDVLAGLYGKADLEAAVRALASVGATSGGDMLHGMALLLDSTIW